MEPEQPTEEQPVEPQLQTVEEIPSDDPTLKELQQLNESMAWNIGFQVIIMCILLFTLFFNALKAGKSR